MLKKIKHLKKEISQRSNKDINFKAVCEHGEDNHSIHQSSSTSSDGYFRITQSERRGGAHVAFPVRGDPNLELN